MPWTCCVTYLAIGVWWGSSAVRAARPLLRAGIPREAAGIPRPRSARGCTDSLVAGALALGIATAYIARGPRGPGAIPIGAVHI